MAKCRSKIRRKTNKNCNFKIGTIAWKQHKVKLARLRNKRYRDKNKHVVENKRLKARYGISIDDYQQLYQEQSGLCKICSMPEMIRIVNGNQVRALAIDHNHKTGKVRGLLCYKCNVGLGSFNDDTKLLKQAIDYLRD